MSASDLALLTVAAYFSFYGIFCSVSYATALAVIRQSMANPKAPNGLLIRPTFEAVNIFLAFGTTALVLLFHQTFRPISHTILSILAVALAALALRTCIVLRILYIKDRVADKISPWLFAIASLAMPLSFSAAGIYLLSGRLFWQTHLGGSLAAAAVFGVLAPGLLLINRRANKKYRLGGELFFTLWLLAFGSLVPLVAERSMIHLQSGPIIGIEILSGAGLMALMAQYMGIIKRKLWLAAMAIAFAAPILLAWASRSNLVVGKLTLAPAFGAHTSAAIAISAGFPLFVLGFWLFAKRVSFNKVTKLKADLK